MISEKNQVMIYCAMSIFLASFFAIFSYVFEIFVVMFASLVFMAITIGIIAEYRRLRDHSEYPEWPEPPTSPPKPL